MRVRRGSSSPPLLLDNGKAEPPTSVNGSTNYYQFELEAYHVERGKRGQKVFTCDICPSGVFKRSFSLKRHYLRFHINFAFLSPRDLNNCAIAVAGQNQRSGGALLGDHGSANGTPLLYRCHQCGYLMRSKEELLKHLDTHPSEADAAELLKGDQRSNNRCPRCSTAFTLRKTLMRHIKKNRCRGGTQPAHQNTDVKSDADSGAQSEEQSSTTSFVHEIHPVYEDDNEDMDMEASLKLENGGSLFRYACTLCSKMFSSYVNMCRHRRLAHGRYGMCSSNWLQSRKSSARKSSPSYQSMQSQAIFSHSFARRTFTFHNYSHFVQNADDNLQRFLHGKNKHIKSLVNTDTVKGNEVDEIEASNRQEIAERWSWGEEGCSLQEVHRLDVPLQKAFRRSLEVSKTKEFAGKGQEVQEEEETSHSATEAIDVLTLLSLRLAPSSSSQSKEKAVSTIQRPELSGEWTRKKSYICSPCGQMFKDFLTLLDHQYSNHASVNCTHVQLDQSMEEEVADELTEQITRSGNGPADPPAVLQCTKCQFVVESIAELHSHILLCSNHVSASPYKKQRRTKVSSSSKSNKPWGVLKHASRGMQRTFSQTKNSYTSIPRSLRSRSPKDNSRQEIIPNGVAKKNARRALTFNDPSPISKKKKKDAGVKRILRQRVDIRQVSQPIQTTIKTMIKNEVAKKKKGAASLPVEQTPKSSDLHECDACKKQFKSNTSVLKHKYYCPNRKTESSQPAFVVYEMASPSTSLPSVSEKSKKTSSKKDKIDKTSKNSVAKQTRSNSKVRSSSSPGPKSSPKQNLNTSSSRATDTLSTKKNVKKPPQASKEKNRKKKQKSVKNDNSKDKKAIHNRHVSSDEDNSDEEMTPPRPVRLSRKSSNLNMEDQVEASFLEALSPEQRVRVGEQKCPFCKKHYVYRSNFKKHLVEGCDSVDVEEEKPSSSQAPSKIKNPSTPVISIESKRSVGVKRSADASPSSSRKETQKKTPKVEVSSVPNKPLLRKAEKKQAIKEKSHATPVPSEKPKKKNYKSPSVLETSSSKKKLKPVVVKEDKAKSDGGGIKSSKQSGKDVKKEKKVPKSIKLSIKTPKVIGTSKTLKSKAQLIKVSKKKQIQVSKSGLSSKKKGKETSNAAKAKKTHVKPEKTLKKSVPTTQKEKNVYTVSSVESQKVPKDQVPESVITEKLSTDLHLLESENVKNTFPVALHQVVTEEEHLSADVAESLPGKSASNPVSDSLDHVQSHPCAKENGTEQLTDKSCSNFTATEKEGTDVDRISDVLDNVVQSLEMVSPVVRQVLDVMSSMEQQEHLKADIAESVPESNTPEECSNLESIRTFTVETGIKTQRVVEECQVSNDQDSEPKEENDHVGSSEDELAIHKLQTETKQSNPSTASRSPNEMETNSHALDRLLLGQALDDAIQKGILKPYSNLTKIPLRIRQLKALFESSQTSTSFNGHHQK